MSISTITSEHSAMIVAELSANHGHRIETALATVRAAKNAGADAIKIQTYTPDTITLNCDNEYFQIRHKTIWDGTTLYKLYQEAYTPWEWHEVIRDEALKVGLEFFSTPFDPTAVDFLESLGVPCYKIASFEITDIPLIEYTAGKGKPIILSTGIADLGMIEEAVAACRRVGNEAITLLKCTSSYPAPPEDANLLTMVNLRETFGVTVGLSDHTTGSAVAIAAIALGARVVEKHFIIDRSIGGPDASFSMEPDEFKAMVDAVRTAEKAIGRVSYAPSEAVMSSRKFARSLFVVQDVKKGDVVTAENVRSIRPGDGMHPRYYATVQGRFFAQDVARGTPLSITMLES